MSSDDRPPPQRTYASQSSAASGPYVPRNDLHSSTNRSENTQPTFGSTTPLKSKFSRPEDAASYNKPFVSKVQYRAAEFMQPIRAGAPEDEWRRKPVVDLTADDPQIIQRPVDYPTFAGGPFTSNSSNFTSVNTKPPVYSLPGGGAIPGKTYYGGEYVDPEKTTKSIKELLEGINDEPVPKRKKKKKSKKGVKTEDDELADLMGKTELKAEDDPIAAAVSPSNAKFANGGVKAEEEANEEEEEEEEEDEDLSRVDGLNVTLLPHQIRGLAFLHKREEGKARGGVLADDMGLGKTIQSIALILSHTHPKYPIGDGPAFSSLSPDSKKKALKLSSDTERGTLVVAPLALIKQWEGEIDRRTEDTHKLRVRVHHGPNRTKDPKVLRKYDVVITTYDVMRSEHSQSLGDKGQLISEPIGCFGLRWWRVICDEAHTIKNRSAKVTKAAYALKAQYRWCLTGTPLQNNLEELQSLLAFLRIAPFDDFAVWKEQIMRPMNNNKGNIAIERLRVVLGAIMLRRTKDVLKKDAEKAGPNQTNQIKLMERRMEKIIGEFDQQEQDFYSKLEARAEESLHKMMASMGYSGSLGGSNMTSALVLLLRLRQACNHPHLLAGKLVKDKDSGIGLATPRKKSTKPLDDTVEDDELADLMGGLSVNQRKCDVCLTRLTQDEIDNGQVRCFMCDDNLENVVRAKKKSSLSGTKKIKSNKSKKAPKLKKRRRPAVMDSDDEDEEAEEDEEEEEEEEAADAGSDDSLFDSQAEESDTPESGQEDEGNRDEEDLEEEDEDEASDFEEDQFSHLIESTKIRHLLKILKSELSQKNKTIVFSQFTSMLDIIEPFLHKEGIAFARYDGSMKNDDREASLRRLRGEGEFAPRKGRDGRDKNWCGVLLCSLKCGALGLNLIAACRVIILEPFWNPFIEEQAIDRVHRIGQNKDVVVYKFTIKNSVEERILRLQEEKRELAKQAIGDGDIAGKAKAAKLSMKDIMSLFKPGAEAISHGPSSTLGSRTRILKEVRTVEESTPRTPPVHHAGRYTTPEYEAAQEIRRAAERTNPYGRR